MPADHTLNLAEVIRRLGIKTGLRPPLGDQLHAEVRVADVSALVPPLLPPMAWAGGFVAAVALQAATLTVEARSNGGLFIRTLIPTTGVAATAFRWAVLDPPAPAPVGALTPVNMGPDPVRSVANLGTSAVVLGGTPPRAVVPGTVSEYLTDLAYVAPGRVFVAQAEPLNVGFGFSVLWEEVPAGALPA